MAICLERGLDCLHMAQLMPLHPQTPSSLASLSQTGFTFLVPLTQVVLEKMPLNGCNSSSCSMFVSGCLWKSSEKLGFTVRVSVKLSKQSIGRQADRSTVDSADA